METTIAFRAGTWGNNCDEAPACLVLNITDALRQKILDAVTVLKQYAFDHVSVDVWFDTPVVCDEALAQQLEDDEYVAVGQGEFDEVETQGVDCKTLVVSGNDMWLRCFAHYSDYMIESPPVNIADVLAVTPASESMQAAEAGA